MNLKTTLFILLFSFPLIGFSQDYLMDGSPITDCSGFFMDSGGGMSSYSPNESFTTTICSDGTDGTHIQLVFSGTVLGAGDDICFFDGEDDTAPQLSCASEFEGAASFIVQATAPNTSGCLTVVFTSDGSDEGEGWSADINCIASCQLITAVLEMTDPLVEPADTGWIDVCPGERIFLDGIGMYPQDGIVYNHSDFTSTFEWDFGDGTFGFGPNVSHQYDEPGGYIIQLEITDQFGCKNTNFISQRVRVSTTPTFGIGGALAPEICAGDTIELNAMVNLADSTNTISVTPNEGSFLVEGIRSDSLALPDGDGASYETSISFTDFSPGQVLTDVNDLLSICVVMEHSWMRDLEIMLTCPNGETVILHDHPGQVGGEVFLGEPFEADEGGLPIPGLGYEYCWTPNATNGTWIQYANANFPNTLPEGDYNSFQPLSNFLGCPLNGEWTITVTDLWGIDNGFIFSWSINFNQDLYPSIETFTPNLVDWNWESNPSIFFQTQDSIAAAPENAGTASYTFTVLDDFGCTYDTSVNLQVLPFTHPDCYSCIDNLVPVEDTTICAGEMVDLDVFVPVPEEDPVTFEAFPFYEFSPINHPPANPYPSTIDVASINPITISNPTTDIISVCLDLETDFDADISIWLQSPSGDIMELSTNNGGGGDNYTQTCFTPTAIIPITAGSPPFTGDFQPEGNWNELVGSPINGTWSLLVADAFGPAVFSLLNSWSITFNTTNEVAYTWSGGGLSCNNCPDPTASPTQTTNYTVTSTDSHACVSSDDFTITVLESFIAPTIDWNIAPNTMVITWNEIGIGLNYEININGAGWIDPNNGIASHILTGLTNGDVIDIEVRVKTFGATCDVQVAMETAIYFLCLLEASIDPNWPTPYSVSCPGECDGSVPISGVGGTAPFTYNATYLDDGTMWSQNNGFFTGLCAGDYRMIVEDDVGCLDTLFFTVVEPDPIVIDIAETISIDCFGNNTGQLTGTATGGTNPLTYVWDDQFNQITPVANNLIAGTYILEVTDSNGCSNTASFDLMEPTQMSLMTSSTNVLCNGEASGTATVIADGGVGNYTYQWSEGDTPTAASTGGLSQGLVSVTVLDGNNCEITETVTINQPTDPLTVSIDQTLNGCFGEDNSEAMATASGGTGPYDYSWSNLSLNQTTNNLAPQSYTVTVTDDANCTAEASIVISELDQVTFSINFVLPSCSNLADGAMGVDPMQIQGGAGGPYNYDWSNSQTTNFIDQLSGGTSYTLTVTDAQGCTGVESRFLSQPEPITFNFNTVDVACSGDATGSASVVDITNGQTPFEYDWSSNAANQNTQTAVDLTAGDFSVTVTDVNGCSAEDLVSISEPTPIQVDFTVIDNECFGDSDGAVDAEVSGGVSFYNFEWQNLPFNESKITGLPSETYVLSITDSNGCLHVDSAFVDQPAPIDPIITSEDVSCFGDRDGTITLEPQGGTPPFTYSLDGENFFGSSTLIGLEEGDYTVFIKDSNGCTSVETASVGSPDEFIVNIERFETIVDELTINLGDTARIFGIPEGNQGGVEFYWSATYCGTMFCIGADSTDCAETIICNGPLIAPDNPITYTLVAVDEMGCEAETNIVVFVDKERRVLVPTGFTPGINGINSALHVHGKEGTKVNIFRVFDRWGELLYEAEDFEVNDEIVGWDGTFQGQNMPAGVYIWYLEAEYVDGMTESFRGSTTLLR